LCSVCVCLCVCVPWCGVVCVCVCVCVPWCVASTTILPAPLQTDSALLLESTSGIHSYITSKGGESDHSLWDPERGRVCVRRRHDIEQRMCRKKSQAQGATTKASRCVCINITSRSANSVHKKTNTERTCDRTSTKPACILLDTALANGVDLTDENGAFGAKRRASAEEESRTVLAHATCGVGGTSVTRVLAGNTCIGTGGQRRTRA
jgi:hypothetical protein